jgi:low affinity Fe/Cu permease
MISGRGSRTRTGFGCDEDCFTLRFYQRAAVIFCISNPVKENSAAGFSRFAGKVADAVGTSWAFAFAMLTIAAWLATGPAFHFSDSWQLAINTWTNFVTFAMVFLIQHTEKRDSKAINLKLDELLRAVGSAQDDLIDIESLSNEELDRLEFRYAQIRRAREARRKRKQN